MTKTAWEILNSLLIENKINGFKITKETNCLLAQLTVKEDFILTKKFQHDDALIEWIETVIVDATPWKKEVSNFTKDLINLCNKYDMGISIGTIGFCYYKTNSTSHIEQTHIDSIDKNGMHNSQLK